MPKRHETETTITWTMADEKATVFSMMPKVWKACERAGGELPRVSRRDGRIISKEYAVEVGAIRIRPVKRRNVSDGERQRRAEHMRKVRKRPISVEVVNELTSAPEDNAAPEGPRPDAPPAAERGQEENPHAPVA